MLQAFGSGIWISDGSSVEVLGFHYPTRMVVIRMVSGGLFIWSPIALTPDLKAAVEKLGPIQHIVAPNSLHHLSLPEWAEAFPEASLHAAPRLAKKREDIAFDFELEGDPHPDWAGEIDQVILRGNLITDEVVFFHRASGTVLFVDILQQFPKGWHKGWRAIVAKLDLMVAPEPSVPRKFRTAFTKRKLARVDVLKILDWPSERVLMAHGTPVEAGAHAYLKRAFAWLL